MSQVGYALLDFEDAYGITDVGVFSARYAHFTTWGISELLDELAGRPVSVVTTRLELRQLLHRLRGGQG